MKFRTILDWSKVMSWLGEDRVVFQYSPPTEKNVTYTSPWWDRVCAHKISRECIEKAIIPNLDIQSRAKKRIVEMKQRGVSKVLSVHIRSMEGACETFPKNTFCHETTQVTQGNLDQCKYQPSSLFFEELKKEFPDFDENQVAVFLSKDGPKADQVFLNRFKDRLYLPEPSAADDHMALDMWTSVLADYYVAHTASSCEPIIAQWKANLFGKENSRIYPSVCYSGYFAEDRTFPLCGPEAKWDYYWKPKTDWRRRRI